MAKSNMFARLLSDGQDYRGKARYFLNLAQKGLIDSIEAPANGRVPSPVQVRFSRRGTSLQVAGNDPLDFEPGDAAFEAAFNTASPRSVDLVFDGEACIDLDFSIPNGPLVDLSAIIENEIAFLSPFETATALTFWVADEAEAGWDVRASVAMRSRVDPVLEYLDTRDVAVGAVRRKTAKQDWAARPAWIATGERVRSLPRWALIPAAATAFFLLSLGLSYIVTSSRSGADEAKLAQARQILVREAEVQQSVAALEDARSMSFAKVILLGEATTALDDTTWVEQFTIRDNKLEITGYGPSAADVSQTLAGIGAVGEVRFSSPVTRDNTQNTERFRLEARIGGALR